MPQTNSNSDLVEYLLRIGDTSLIAGQRMSEWCGHAPILEEDIALSNISLDLIGQARIILSYVAELQGDGKTEDDIAFHRDERQYRNVLLSELPNGNFAQTIAKQFLISVYQFHLYSALKASADKTLSAFADKSLKEVAYHVRHFSDWMIRLGDGTAESHEKLQTALNDIWYYVEDLFMADEIDQKMEAAKIGADFSTIHELWKQTIADVLSKSKVSYPELNSYLRAGSRQGKHTEHLGFLLAEMQYLPRAYPDATW